MPAILGWLLRGLVWIAGSFGGQLLVGLGIGVATYTGARTVMTSFKSQAVSAFLGLDPDVLGMLGILKVGQAISIVFSAMVIRATLQGLSSDTVKRFVKR